MRRRDLLALAAAAMANPSAQRAAQKATLQTAGCTSGVVRIKARSILLHRGPVLADETPRYIKDGTKGRGFSPAASGKGCLNSRRLV